MLAFTVSMDRTRDAAVRVDYATEDGSAKAGEDYTPVTGTLTIAGGGREGTVEVPVLPALHVTGERTLTLKLSNARGAVIDDASATGTIVRESELPKAWLARFGRTASDHAAQAIAGRLETGGRETHVTVAGRRLDGLSVDGLVSGALPSRGGGLASTARNVVTRLAAPALDGFRRLGGGSGCTGCVTRRLGRGSGWVRAGVLQRCRAGVAPGGASRLRVPPAEGGGSAPGQLILRRRRSTSRRGRRHVGRMG